MLDTFEAARLSLPLVGGALLAGSASLLLNDHGKVFGCSGAIHSLLSGSITEPVKVGIAVGLVGGGAVLRTFQPLLEASLGKRMFDVGVSEASGAYHLSILVASGLLVGLGTKLGSGCTSGHMLCGVSRGSARSIAATATFFPTALFTHRLLDPYLPSRPAIVDVLKSTDFSNRPLACLILASPSLLYLLLRRLRFSQTIAFLQCVLLGATFSFGLALAGMSCPSVVLGFFDVGLRSFDPSLLGVAIAGLGGNTLIYWKHIAPRVRSWIKAEKVEDVTAREALAPVSAKGSGWQLPELKNSTVDRKLLGGSLLFGIGWGLAGICPGPALLNLGASPLSYGIFCWLASFALGSWSV